MTFLHDFLLHCYTVWPGVCYLPKVLFGRERERHKGSGSEIKFIPFPPKPCMRGFLFGSYSPMSLVKSSHSLFTDLSFGKPSTREDALGVRAMRLWVDQIPKTPWFGQNEQNL